MYFSRGFLQTCFYFLFQSHVPAGCRGDGMHIYFLRSSHDLRFHDILFFCSRLMPVTCNDKIVKAGVDGLLILHGPMLITLYLDEAIPCKYWQS